MKRTVKIGLTTLPRPMTYAQALKFGNRHMPEHLKRTNFKTVIFVSDKDINGSLFYRINFAK